MYQQVPPLPSARRLCLIFLSSTMSKQAQQSADGKFGIRSTRKNRPAATAIISTMMVDTVTS